MRPDFVFSERSVSPSFFFTTPAKKPRTEFGCQPVNGRNRGTVLGLGQAKDMVVLRCPSS
jgi:hypothetical protein